RFDLDPGGMRLRIHLSGRGPYASVLSRRELGISNINSLKGRTVAAVHPLALTGGLSQLGYLASSGFNPVRDLDVHYCGSPEEAFKMLVAGWVEAAFVPEAAAESVFSESGLSGISLDRFPEIQRLGPVLGSVILFKRSLVEDDPVLDAHLREVLARQRGSGTFVPAKREYYVTVREYLQAVGQVRE
ncbi:MAG TPA: PhnD/SsuA/transferrin family substrate-binding protein, partial [bacterium]|nr:PhnD/SsuA/transferrin family substrate-binding protein [bacterium]